jgi:hypothetical protein
LDTAEEIGKQYDGDRKSSPQNDEKLTAVNKLDKQYR